MSTQVDLGSEMFNLCLSRRNSLPVLTIYNFYFTFYAVEFDTISNYHNGHLIGAISIQNMMWNEEYCCCFYQATNMERCIWTLYHITMTVCYDQMTNFNQTGHSRHTRRTILKSTFVISTSHSNAGSFVWLEPIPARDARHLDQAWEYIKVDACQ